MSLQDVLSLEAEQRFSEAEALCGELRRRQGDSVALLRHQAGLCGLTGQGDRQLELLRQATALDPGDGELALDLAAVLQGRGQVEEALAAMRAALEVQPDDYVLLVELGKGLQQLGRDDEALPYFFYATSLEPRRSPAILCTALSLLNMGEVAQAAQLLAIAEEVDPDNPDLLNLVGVCYINAGQLSRAVVCLEKALSLADHDRDIMGNLALVQHMLGDLEAAIASGRRALELQPFDPQVLHNLLFAYSTEANRYNDDALQLAAAYADHLREGLAPLPPQALQRPPFAAAAPRQLRIGFLSAEIGSHVVGRFLDAFLRHHDRSAFAVELLSMTRRYEERSRELAGRADAAHSLVGLEPGRAREFLLERRYDILVETSGYTAGSGLSLLAQRCAPIQCHYIGYHASTGFDTIDYFIGDAETAAAELQPQFVERLWRLPRPWLACTLDEPPPPARAAAESAQPVLGSFNQLPKVRQQTLAYWGAALRAVPEARLLIKDGRGNEEASRQRLLAGLAAQGVAAERITFLDQAASHREHLELYNRLDIALDATPWSSATTGFDALSMGVPLVAIRGGCMAARMSSSLVKAVGQPDWVADSPDAYAAVVARLCAELEPLRRGRAERQARVLQGPLFDAADLAACLGQAFQEMAAAGPSLRA